MYLLRMKDVVVPLNYKESDLKRTAENRLGLKAGEVLHCKIYKKSLDARKKPMLKFVLTLDLSLKEEIVVNDKKTEPITDVQYIVEKVNPLEKPPVVVGFGPSGMFAALVLAQAGLCPTVVERGSKVEKRQGDTRAFWKKRELDQESNVQFGEGGAGTFSDGKLNTGVKDFRIRKVLTELVKAGAPEEILWESKPHVGTDKLPSTVKGIREEIIKLGGKVLFNTKMTKLIIKENKICGVNVVYKSEEKEIETQNVVLAIGHSARDTFRYLNSINIPMQAKAFSVGARIEHRAELINVAQYGGKNSALPAADYKLAARLLNGRSAYTFCMCPGGYVVGAASEKNKVVTNGMSTFARDGENSNAALLVGVTPEDFGENVLDGLSFQEKIEESAFAMAGANYNAPVQRVEDFLQKRQTRKMGDVKPTYEPGTAFVDINKVLPEFVAQSMAQAIKSFAGRIKGFDMGDALLTAPETRSSSPIKIMRGEDFESPIIKGLYPCGEGAGWAGGIVSAAVDGIKCAEAVFGKTNR